MNTVNPLGLVSECQEAEDTLIFSIEAMSRFLGCYFVIPAEQKCEACLGKQAG
jgi:hypothetical protein